MRKPLACALAGLVVCAFGAAPPRASADAAVTSAVGQVAKLTSQAGILLSNPFAHVNKDDEAGPTSTNVTTYDESVSSHQDDPGGPSVLSSTGGNINQPNVVIGKMTSDASVGQRTVVTSDAVTVDVESSAIAEVAKTSVVGNCCFLPLGSGATSFDLQIVIARPCRYRLGGALSATSDDPKHSAIFVQLSLTGDDGSPSGGFNALASSSDRNTASLVHSGVFQPGPVGLHVTLSCDLGSVDTSGRVSFNGGSQGRASWVFSLSLAPADFPADIRWAKRSGGDFGTAANWSPQQVPVNGAPDADNAIFDLPGTYTVGFGAAQASGRLEVLQGGVTFANANYAVDGLALAAPSLVVDTGKLTLGSGHLTSNSATIGDVHDSGAEVRVDGSTSRWDCLGRLCVGGADGSAREGTLTISNGGTVTTGETRIGTGGAQHGAAGVDGKGSNWSTANVAVGFSSAGFLGIENGAQVSSGDAVVGLGQPVGQSATVFVDGVDPSGAAAQWNATTLTVGRSGGINSVNAFDGGSVSAADVTVGDGAAGIGTVTVTGIHGSPQTASLLSVSGRLTVGTGGGHGDLQVRDGGGVSVTFHDMEIGDRGTGIVSVAGADATSGAASSLDVAGVLTVGDRASGNGTLFVNGGGLVTSGSAIVGSLTNSFGRVVLTSDPASAAVSTWHAKGDFILGSLGGVGLVGLHSSALVVDGNFIESDGGIVLGTGTLTVSGTLTANGSLAPTIVQEPGLVPLGPSKRRSALRAKAAAPVAGTLTIQGDLVVGPTGVVRAEAAGAQSDRLVVTGDATLDGTLVLQFKNGFAPKANAQFELFHVNGNVTGAFATVTTRGLAPGAQFDVTSVGGAFTVKALNDTVALPTVSVKASAKKLLEKKAKKTKATLTFSRKGPTTAPLVVAYTVGGTATNGIDYVSLPGVITIPAKKKSVKVTVQLVDDPFAEPTETIDVAVVPGADYTESLASAASISIADNPPSR
jgi:T5SS/PEP-CTERM-associated repeat protein